jgi:hypothetical protein
MKLNRGAEAGHYEKLCHGYYITTVVNTSGEEPFHPEAIRHCQTDKKTMEVDAIYTFLGAITYIPSYKPLVLKTFSPTNSNLFCWLRTTVF